MTVTERPVAQVPALEEVAEPPRSRRGPDAWAWLGMPAVLFMLLAFVAPLVWSLVQTFTDPGPVTYADAVRSELFRRSLGLTFSMAFTVTAISLVVSYPFAYVMARGGPRMRGFLLAAVMVSFWTSFLVRTFSWQVLLGNSGLVNDALQYVGFTDAPVQLIRTGFAVDLAMVHILAPFLILAIYAQLRTIPPELELAAQSMGARPSVAFWRVIVPLSLPGAFAGAVLVFVMALGFYITPQILGDSGKSYLGQVVVLQVERFFQFGTAAAMSVILLVIVLVILGVAGKFVGLRRLLGLSTGARR